MLKVAVCVILYKPDETVPVNIRSYAGYFSRVYLFDNSEKPHGLNGTLSSIPNTLLIQDMENRGISERLNKACDLAAADGYEWLLTMDQDSSYEKKMIDEYLRLFTNFTGKENVAQFGTNNKEENDAGYKKPVQEFEEADMMITSGSLVNLGIWKALGGFDNAYFIDHVDNDYCIRARLAGYRLIYFPNVFLSHRFGEKVKRSSIKSLYLVKKYKVVHSPLRCYYILRNTFYFEKKFAGNNLPAIDFIITHAKNYIQKSRYYNGFFWKTNAYLQKAKMDFKKGKTGKIDRLL